MVLTIFAKKRTTTEGKKFYSFLTKLHNKNDGSELVTTVKFPEDMPIKADACPINIDVEKGDCNLAFKKFEKEDGTTVDVPTLWIKNYSISKDVYVDTSMDDYE